MPHGVKQIVSIYHMDDDLFDVLIATPGREGHTQRYERLDWDSALWKVIDSVGILPDEGDQR